MTNLNDSQLPRGYRGQKNQEGSKGQGGIPKPYDVFDHNEIRQQGGEESPALFGESQVEGGFGPIYAIPSFPWEHGGGLGTGGSQWQHGGDLGPYGDHWQHGGDFGPVYAIPSFPWQHSGGPAPSGGQWQQWGSHHPQAMPCCMWPPGGYLM